MLTVAILTKNEEEQIERCIKSVSFADEIIVIDDFSTDETISIARKLGATIFQHDLNDNFSEQRNFALSKASHPYVLFVDADEEVSPELASEIKSVIDSGNDGAYIKRIDVIFGKTLKYGEFFNFKLLRLANKSSGKWMGRVHETWKVSGTIVTLKNPLLHYSHTNTHDFISDIEYYSTLHAREKYDNGEKSSLFKIIFYPILKLKYNLFLRLGILDGQVGFIVSMLMSFHSFLSWSKLWLMQRKLEYKKY